MPKNLNSKFKKLLCALLAALLLTGCGGSVPEETAGTAQPATEMGTEAEPEIEEAEETEAESLLVDSIPSADYNGYTFNYITEYWEGTVADRFLREMHAEEITGEPINDAVWERNSYVEEKLNIKITAGDSTAPATDVQAAVKAGDDVYQLAGAYKFNTFPLLRQGVLRDWNDLTGLDLTGEWWNSEAIAKLSIQNRQYMMSGSILMSEIDDTLAMVFNKKLQNDYGLDNIYDLVENGTWTLDKMAVMVEKVSSDLDGDGKMVFGNDLFGYAQDPASMTYNWSFSLDLLNGKVTEDNTYDWNINTERVMTSLEQLAQMLGNSNTDTNTEYYEGLDVFAEGKIYIYSIILSALEIIREMEDDFGIIPYPKLEESQSQYYNHVGSQSPILAIPVTNVSDDGRTAAILNALAISSHQYVRPVYFENVLKGKLSRDPQTQVMLDIIQKSATYDIGYLAGSSPLTSISNLIKAKQTDFASAWAKNEKALTKQMNNLIAKILEQ